MTRPCAHDAVRLGDGAALRLFLENGGDPDLRLGGDGVTLLHIAVSLERTDCIKLLVAAGADPGKRSPADDPLGASPLHMAANRTPDVLHAVLQSPLAAESVNGFFRAMRGNTAYDDALRVALFAGKIDNARLLVAHGALVNKQDPRGRAALHDILGSTSAYRPAALRFLLQHGADLAPADNGGDTPLVLAARTGITDALPALLAHGANIDAADGKGRTALHWAAALPSADAARGLIAAGADIEAADKTGNRPLHVAAAHNNAAVTQLLLDAGADPSARNHKRKTPAMLCPPRFSPSSGTHDSALKGRLTRAAGVFTWRGKARRQNAQTRVSSTKGRRP